MKPFANVRCVEGLWFLTSQAWQEKHLRTGAAALTETHRVVAVNAGGASDEYATEQGKH